LLLQRRCVCAGATTSAAGECDTCRGRPLQRRSPQSADHDRHEREADRAADRVVAGGRAQVTGMAAALDPDALPDSVERVLEASGRPLDSATRRYMEPRFGVDFAAVRIHDDMRAAGSARAVAADAYTVGKHVVFDAGRFDPHTDGGRHLLAHELAHVAQQAARPGALQRQPSGGGKPARNPTQRDLAYGREDFDGRFDGVIDTRTNTISLSMRIDFEDQGKPEGKQERITKFRANAKAVIESGWSGKFALQGACAGPVYRTRVEVVPTHENPHTTINLWPQTPAARSKSTSWQEDDLADKVRMSPVLIDEKKPPSKDNIVMREFHQITALHEFGHLMGLKHVLCADNADRCYGVTAEQKADIMGYGSIISERDYAPLVRIAERFGRDTLPAECNRWNLVTPP